MDKNKWTKLKRPANFAGAPRRRQKPETLPGANIVFGTAQAAEILRRRGRGAVRKRGLIESNGSFYAKLFFTVDLIKCKMQTESC